jgi:predicted nucleotidyltransferase
MQADYDKIQYYKVGKREKASLIAKLKALLEKEEQVQQAWVFGSFTRRDSVRDIDVAIRAEPELTFKEYLNLNAQIELELGVPVDLVEIAKAPAPLKENMLKNGIKIKPTD